MARLVNTDTPSPNMSPSFKFSSVIWIRGVGVWHFWGLREGLSGSLSVGLIVGRNMVGIGVVRGAEIFPWPNIHVIPNHVIIATKDTKATAMTKIKTPILYKALARSLKTLPGTNPKLLICDILYRLIGGRIYTTNIFFWLLGYGGTTFTYPRVTIVTFFFL